jgi:uncharacterized membrane protein
MSARTYAERAAQVEPIAAELERIAYRLRQGAISDESAAAKLAELGAQLTVKPTAKPVLTETQQAVIGYLNKRGQRGASTSDLVNVLGISRSTLTGLERRGLIESRFESFINVTKWFAS